MVLKRKSDVKDTYQIILYVFQHFLKPFFM